MSARVADVPVAGRDAGLVGERARLDGGSSSWGSLGVICLGYFVASLAQGPVAAILPSLAAVFEVSVGAAGWIMNVYFLLLVGLVLTMGRLGDAVGHARIFGTGVAISAVGLLLCGLATSFPLLLVGRGVQGIGSAMVLGTSLALLAATVQAERRGRAIGLLTMTASIATLAGTWLATWSVAHADWRLSFLLPVPLGVVGAILGVRVLRPERDDDDALSAAHAASAAGPARRVDWLGAVLLFATLSAATLSISHLHGGEETFQEGGFYHVGMHVLTLALLAVFIRAEQHAEKRGLAPLLSFRLLRDRRFSSGVLANGIAHTSMLATGFLLPFLVERARGWAPADTGLLIVTQQAVGVGASLALGYWYDRARSPVLGVLMMGSIAGGMVILSVWGGTLPFWALVAVACILAAGSSGFSTVNNTAVMSLAPADGRGFASGLLETTRHFGHTIGVGLTSSFLAGAVAGAATPSAASYLDGFAQGALAMGLIALLGVGALLVPGRTDGARGAHLRSGDVAPLAVSRRRPER